MNARRSPSQVVLKGLLVMVLVMLAFQSFGMNSLAAPNASSLYFQEGGNAQALECSPAPTTSCDIQIVLLIDDSSSMLSNDSSGVRNEGARNLVDVLDRLYYSPALLLHDDNPGFRVPDVKVAVIHFSEEVLRSEFSEWITFGGTDNWKTELYDRIDWPKKGTQEHTDLYRQKQYTGFIDPFKKAAELFTSGDAQATDGDCIRRSIMLFTDGTPETRQQGILTGELLKQHMGEVEKIVKELQDPLPEEEKVRIYVTGFKAIRRYWDHVVESWKQIADSVPSSLDGEPPQRVELKSSSLEVAIKMEEITAFLSDIERFAVKPDSPSVYAVLIPRHVQSVRLTLYNLDPATTLVITDPKGVELKHDGRTVILSGKDKSIEVWQLITPVDGNYTAKTSKTGGTVTALLTYQNLSVNFDVDPGHLQVGSPSEIKLTLEDSSGNVVLPEEDPLTLKVLVTQDDQELPLEWTGENYQTSWTPGRAGVNQFKIVADLVDDQGGTLLNCSGNMDVDVQDPEQLAMVITAPACLPPGGATLPLKLTYEGDDSDWASSLQWTVSAQPQLREQDVAEQPNPVSQEAGAQVNVVDRERGEYELKIDPIDNATQIETVLVSAKAQLLGRPLEISDSKTITLPLCQIPVCDCDPIWQLWFWPLLIVLAGLLIVLLVLRFRSAPKETNYRQEGRDLSRSSYWHFLFWPLLILLILLILNRLLWCCVIPLWLFLVLILIWIIFLLWIRFMPDDRPAWRRLWWLVVILLLLLVLIWYIYSSNQWTFLLWLLALLLVLILAYIIWPLPTAYINPPPSPDDLTLIEGIGPKVARLLNEKGHIYTFRELADADITTLNTLLNENDWKYMDPKTWPQQAELADKAKKSGKQEDWDEFYRYTAWVKGGIEPHEYDEAEKDRKPPEEPKRPE